MKLIMVNKYINTKSKYLLAQQLGGKLAEFEYDGCSTKEIEHQLQLENEDVVVVSADSRMMRYAREDSFFKHEDVFIHRNREFKNVTETTKRQLRLGHNMMKLYESGEFEF